MVVAELFATLGIKVDPKAFAVADVAIESIAVQASAAVTAVRAVGGAGDVAFRKTGAAASQAATKVQTFNEKLLIARKRLLQQAEASEINAFAKAQLGFVDPRFAPKAPAGAGAAAVAAATVAPKATGAHAPAGGKPKPGGHGGGGHGANGHLGGFSLGSLLNPVNAAVHGFVAAFAVHEVMHFAHSIMEMGQSFEKTALKTGMSVKAVQTLQYAAKMADVDVGTLNGGLRFLQVNAVAAAKGGKEQAAAFKQLGISVKGANGAIKPSDALFEEVATQLAAITDPAQQTALAVKIFGRSGVELLPILKKGGAGIAELREEAIALGGVMSHETLESAAELEHNIKRLDFAFNGVKFMIANGLLPVLTKFVKGLSAVVGKVNEVYHKTKFLQTLFGVGLVYAVTKAALAIRAAGQEAVYAWVKGAAPIILAIMAIIAAVLVLEDVFQLLTGGKSAIGKWLDQWAGLGTADKLTRDWAAGIKMLREEILALMQIKNSALLESIMHPITAMKEIGAAYDGTMKHAELKGKYESYLESSKSSDPIMAAIGKRKLAQFTKDNFGSQLTAPRTTERGLMAPKEETVFGRAGYTGTLAGKAPEHGGGDHIEVHTEIHATTGMKPEDLEHHVMKGVHKGLAKQAKRVQHAHAPRTGGE
jgi:hypothetical protein